MIAEVSSIIALGVAIVIAYVVVLWVALAFYVVRDARHRSTSSTFVALAALLGFAPPFLGALIYFMLRPPRTLDEIRAQALEEQALLEPPIDSVLSRPCPTCGREIEEDFIVCPYCRTQFARRCVTCDRSLRLGWTVCPYCATEVGAQAMARAAH